MTGIKRLLKENVCANRFGVEYIVEFERGLKAKSSFYEIRLTTLKTYRFTMLRTTYHHEMPSLNPAGKQPSVRLARSTTRNLLFNQYEYGCNDKSFLQYVSVTK